MVVHLWIRQDGGEPKAIEAGVAPPGPGQVVAVTVPGGVSPVKEARRLLEVSRRQLPELDPSNPEASLALRAEVEAARLRVREVTS